MRVHNGEITHADRLTSGTGFPLVYVTGARSYFSIRPPLRRTSDATTSSRRGKGLEDPRPWETGGIIVERMYPPWNSSEKGWFRYFSLPTLPSLSSRGEQSREILLSRNWDDDDDVVVAMLSLRLSAILWWKLVNSFGKRWFLFFFFLADDRILIRGVFDACNNNIVSSRGWECA